MARNFNGTNQYLSRTATLPSSPLSISVWFKPTVIGSHTVFSFGNLAVNQDRYAVFYFSPGIVVFQVSPGNVVFSSNMVSAGVYNNITTTDDGNTKNTDCQRRHCKQSIFQYNTSTNNGKPICVRNFAVWPVNAKQLFPR